MWVPPFRHLRIVGYLPLPAAFRSLSRLSSAPSAKASSLRPSLLNLFQSGSIAHFLVLPGPAVINMAGPLADAAPMHASFMVPFLSCLAWHYSAVINIYGGNLKIRSRHR